MRPVHITNSDVVMNGYKCKAQFLKADKKMTDLSHINIAHKIFDMLTVVLQPKQYTLYTKHHGYTL